MNKKEIQDYKDKRNLEKGFNAYWNQGFDEAIDLIKKNEPKQLIIDSVVSSAYMVKIEGNGTMIILAENIAYACDKLEAKGYNDYTFIKSTSFEVVS